MEEAGDHYLLVQTLHLGEMRRLQRVLEPADRRATVALPPRFRQQFHHPQEVGSLAMNTPPATQPRR